MTMKKMPTKANRKTTAERLERVEAFLSSIGEIVQTKRLELRDHTGQRRALLTTSPEGEPVFHLLGAEGKTMMVLEVAKAGPRMSLHDRTGACVTWLGYGNHWHGLEVSQGSRDGTCARIGIGPTGMSIVVLAGPKRLVQGVLSVSPEGIPRLELLNQKQEIIFDTKKVKKRTPKTRKRSRT